MPHDSPGILVFRRKDHGEIRMGVMHPPTGTTKAGGVGYNRPLLRNNSL